MTFDLPICSGAHSLGGLSLENGVAGVIGVAAKSATSGNAWKYASYARYARETAEAERIGLRATTVCPFQDSRERRNIARAAASATITVVSWDGLAARQASALHDRRNGRQGMRMGQHARRRDLHGARSALPTRREALGNGDTL
jgi:hypothetical protein